MASENNDDSGEPQPWMIFLDTEQAGWAQLVVEESAKWNRLIVEQQAAWRKLAFDLKAARDDLRERLTGASAQLEQLLHRGTTPTPAEIGEVLAALGGENPYASVRPADADPWWGCWTDSAALPEYYQWERYQRTIDPDAQLDGLGDLCAFLGGTWSDSGEGGSVTALILRLIVKSQATPDRYAAVSRAFPREATAWRVWMALSPSPTARELCDELVSALPAVVSARVAGRLPGTAQDVAAGLARPAARRHPRAGCRFCGVTGLNAAADLEHELDCDQRPRAQAFDLAEPIRRCSVGDTYGYPRIPGPDVYEKPCTQPVTHRFRTAGAVDEDWGFRCFEHAGWLDISVVIVEPLGVRNFGAVGDGVADDTPAIQAAFNSAASSDEPNRRFELRAYEQTDACRFASILLELDAGTGAPVPRPELVARWAERYPRHAAAPGKRQRPPFRTSRTVSMLLAAGLVESYKDEDDDQRVYRVANREWLQMSARNLDIVQDADGVALLPSRWARRPEAPEHLRRVQDELVTRGSSFEQLPSAAPEVLAQQITDRAIAMLPALGPLTAGEAAGAAALVHRHLPHELRPLVPADARAYALPWPAGTRAVYDPVAGVTVRETGRDRTGMADVEVLSRTLVVTFDVGDDADRFPVGAVRRLTADDKSIGNRWWECRYCHLGATGSASIDAERAECLGHEAICPDRDRMNLSIPRTAGPGPVGHR